MIAAISVKLEGGKAVPGMVAAIDEFQRHLLALPCARFSFHAEGHSPSQPLTLSSNE
ncbi:hypothetical protein [Brevifollis gellanilyticus]|uniref:hypothetical protein n=1 Tax=Brevifollis gellanilyticus TaxID=748831 RepID=UPI0014785289|nr:hypothetical protein [Brevifollis gellanilyticus]